MFLTFHHRPLFSVNFDLHSYARPSLHKVGILMQGPLLAKNNFTVETVKIYQKIFKNQPVIVSTWEDEETALVEAIQKLPNVVVVLNKKPKIAGTQHINYQIISSSAGAQKAQELGCHYVLKTRTDQRIYAPNILPFLINILELFPLSKRGKQHKRIVGSSLYSFKYRLYSISDMFLFGTTPDMIRFLSPPLDKRKLQVESKNLLQYSRLRLGEMYLVTEFLKTVGHTVLWTLADSWKAYSERFIIVDQQALDIFWYKYSAYQEYKFLEYDAIKNNQILNFKEWFLLYSTKLRKQDIPEKTLLGTFSDPVTY